ncbi:MAG: PHP domain-containing protein [Armatimonadota bacterium]|nr:PHP domain-containing protein [Armatimonadota bacterium]
MDSSFLREVDLHIHTWRSACARSEMRLAAIVETAAERGLKFVGVTDHVDAYVGPNVLWETEKELTQLRTSVRVFLGCEADILAVGKHVVSDEMKTRLDYIMVSANHFHDPAVSQPIGNSPVEVAKHFLEMFSYACSLGFVDVIAHPLVVFSNTFDTACLDFISDEDIAEAALLARRNGIAMEISPRGFDQEQRAFRIRFLSICKQVGLKFAIGTDAHSLDRIGSTWRLEPLLAEVGITDEDIWLPSSRGCSACRAVIE